MKVCYYRLLATTILLGITASPALGQSQKVFPTQENITRSAPTSDHIGNCDRGTATKDLDVNNVRARLYNNGGLFWRGSGNVYTVPKDGNANSIFASGIWIGGLDPGGEIRFAGTAYGPFEYWPGPIDDDGNPPADCSEYDHLYKVSRSDLDSLELTGGATDDILNWPHDLGAPVEDGDGDPDNYDIEAGDRPALVGDQMVWWVMNDAGNIKEWSFTEPIGLEIQVTAFAFDRPGPIQNTTFYKYRLEHKGDEALNDTYLGIWSDPDLGNAADDYVGSDTTLGMGIVYNGRDEDLGFDGYGDIPPALGYDFMQGPLVPDSTAGAVWTDPDGTQYVGMKRLKMTVFLYYNSDSTIQGNPSGSTDDPYQYLQGLWRDGTPMTFGGTGVGGSQVTTFMFPGNAADRAFWSEENTDGQGSRNTPADRRFLMSTGPFDLEPGDVQEIVFGIVWSRAFDRLSSYRQLLLDDVQVQGLYNSNFFVPDPPDAPVVRTEELDDRVILSWENPPSSNNFLESYDQQSDFIVDQNASFDNTYTFEGYNVYQYESAADTDGELIAVYDVVNDVRGVAEDRIDQETGLLVSEIVAKGTDSGIQHYHVIDDLVNYTEYYFGVQPYAYNQFSKPKIFRGPVTRVTVMPTRIDARNGGTRIETQTGEIIPAVRVEGVGTASRTFATIVSPTAVTGDSYEIRFYDAIRILPDGELSYPDGRPDTLVTFTYDLVNVHTADTLIHGLASLEDADIAPPFGVNILASQGLSFDIDSSPGEFTNFLLTANAAGPVVPPTGGSSEANGFPVPNEPGDEQQVGPGVWYYATGDVGTGASYDNVFIPRSIRNGFDIVIPYDYEVRFTERCYQPWLESQTTGDPFATPQEGCYGYDRFGIFEGGSRPQLVPFEIWNAGINTPDDDSDDFRMIPAIIDWEEDGYNLQFFDHSVSGNDDDPESDWMYWYVPCNQRCDYDEYLPGEAGYERWKSDLLAGTTGWTHGHEVMARSVFVSDNGGSISAATDKADYLNNVVNQPMPERGTVFRLETAKPLTPGDVFAIDTAPYKPITNDRLTAEGAMRIIGIVPNPYRGRSAYEVDRFNDIVRFTNLPERATIRVFSLAGTLIRLIEKNSQAVTLEWDLRNQDGFPIASGMYLVHVEVPGVGETVIKFGVIKGRIQLDLF